MRFEKSGAPLDMVVTLYTAFWLAYSMPRTVPNFVDKGAWLQMQHCASMVENTSETYKCDAKHVHQVFFGHFEPEIVHLE